MIRLDKYMVLLATTVAGCGGAGSNLLDLSPELAPHATTWRSLQEKTPGSGDRMASDFAFPDTFRKLLDVALERSAAVRAARQGWRGQIERVGIAGSLPDPKVSYTWLPDPVETRVGPNESRIGITQAIPSLPGLFAQHSGAVARARAAQAGYDAAVLATLSKLKSTVAQTRYLQQAVKIVDANLLIAKELASAAAKGYADRGSLFDASKARAQLAQLEYDRVRFQELLSASAARLNAILDRSPKAPVPVLDAWPTSPIPQQLETLYEIALKNEPKLKSLDAQLESQMAAISEAQSKFFPDIQVGVQYMANGEARMPGVEDSGKDSMGVTVGLRIPLWFGKHLSRVSAAEADLAKGVELKRGHVNGLLADIESTFYRLRNAARLLALYDTTLLPEAKQVMAESEAWQREGIGGYTDFLEARATYYQFSLTREKAAADRVKAEAALETLIGQSIAGPGAATGEGER